MLTWSIISPPPAKGSSFSRSNRPYSTPICRSEHFVAGENVVTIQCLHINARMQYRLSTIHQVRAPACLACSMTLATG